MAIGSFLFGGNTGDSYESLQRRRQLADALAKQVMGQQPKNTMEGIGSILKGAAAGIGNYRVNQETDSKTAAANAFFNTVMGGTPAADPPGGATPSTAMNSAMPAVGPNGNIAPTQLASGDVYNGFMGAVGQQIKNPYGLAAVAATGQAESSFSPKLAGSSWSDPSASGQAGTSGGTMSWRGPRLEALQAYASSKGEQGNGSPQTQAEFFLHEDPSLVQKLNNAGSVQEAQQLMNNAWAFKGYKSPGGESARRLGYASSYLPRFQGQQAGGTQVASLDPSAGMNDPAAIAATLPVTPINGQHPYRDSQVVTPNAQPSVGGPIMQPQSPMMQQPQQMAANAMPPQQQAAPQQAPAPFTPKPTSINPKYLQLLANPWISDDQKAAVRMMIQQDLQSQQSANDEQTWHAHQDYSEYQRRSDPQYQLNTTRLQQQNSAFQTPQQQEDARRAQQAYDEQQREATPDYKLGLQKSQVELDNAKNPVRPITADERKMWGIPEADTRAYMMTPTEGPKLIGSTGQTINIGSQVEARKQAAADIGLKPDDPRYMGYLANGELPKESQQSLTAVDKKAIQDADDMVQANQSALQALTYAEKLSPEANSGWLAGTRAAIGNNLPDWMVPDVVSSPNSSQATTDMDNAIVGQALSQLKTIFGGNPTEGERGILLQLQGSSSMPAAVRTQVFARARELAEKRLKFNQDKANDLRGGTYYKNTSQSATTGQAPAPNVDDLLKKYGGQ